MTHFSNFSDPKNLSMILELPHSLSCVFFYPGPRSILLFSFEMHAMLSGICESTRHWLHILLLFLHQQFHHPIFHFSTVGNHKYSTERNDIQNGDDENLRSDLLDIWIGFPDFISSSLAERVQNTLTSSLQRNFSFCEGKECRGFNSFNKRTAKDNNINTSFTSSL